MEGSTGAEGVRVLPCGQREDFVPEGVLGQTILFEAA